MRSYTAGTSHCMSGAGTGPGGHIGLESIVVENLSLLSIPPIFYCNNPSLTKAAEREVFSACLYKARNRKEESHGSESREASGNMSLGPLVLR